MALSFFGIVALLLVGAVITAAVIAAVRKPSWVTLLAVPFGLLLLLGIGTVVVSLGAPRVVSYLPPEPMQPVENWDHVRMVDQREWGFDETGPFWVSSPEPTHATGLTVLLIGIPMVLSIGACVTVLALKRKWIAQHANVVLPVLGIGLAGVLAAGLLSVGYFLVRPHPRVVTFDPGFHDRGLQPRQVIDNPRLRLTSNVALETAADAQDTSDTVTAQDTPVDTGEGDTAVGGGATADTAEEVTASPPASELPEWARGETVDWRKLRDGVQLNPVVLKSDEWSSLQEAEVQLEAMAAQALQQQLRMQHGSSFAWQPSKDFVHQSGAIQQRFVEKTVLNLESGPMPMVRTYWQVGATPHVTEIAKQEWKTAAVEERLTMLGAGAAILTLLFAGGAAGLRFDSATDGRYRRRMAGAAVAVGALAAGTAALFVA